MEPVAIGLAAFAILLALTAVGTPLALSLILVGFGGNLFFYNIAQTSTRFYESLFDNATSFILAAVPLFIFMGQLVHHSNIGRDLYECVYRWAGRVPGGLAITAVLSCAGFGAVTGLSAAAVATMGAITMPEMMRYGYAPRFAAGSLAIASTLAILIPPSLLMIIYGLWTETSIGHLFIAGIVPGIMMTAAFCGYIYIRVVITPELGRRGEAFTIAEKLRSLSALLPIFFIFGIVIGGIYAGVLTVSEGAGVGSASVMVLLVGMGRLNWKTIALAVRETCQLTVMVMTIFIGATFFAKFLVVTDISYELVEFIEDISVNRYVVLLAFVVMYLFLGMVLDTIGMLLLTLPIVFPVIRELGFDAIWFGIILTILVEIALVTPPVGFNCFVLHQIVPEIPLGQIFLGVMPFVMIALGILGILTLFPGIVTMLL
ncbi:MAG: TRAP transporter large permease [Alphaproteobacteria bacterium]|nr:TRAP transporter large permease [Alphaproteobacteria bacterium]